MARGLSRLTVSIYEYLWYMPWACAGDIVRFGDPSASKKEAEALARAVSNVLARGEGKEWLVSARLGRVRNAVDRFVFTNAGVEEFEKKYGWKHYWWHTANGVKALARRLEVVEMAYFYLPQLWRSNLVSSATAYVFRDEPGTAWITGEPVMRASLVESEWGKGRIYTFYWQQSGPFEAVLGYTNGNEDDGALLFPLLWRGNFQRPSDIASVRRAMDKVFIEDERRSKLNMDQAAEGPYYPGAVVLCPDRVAAAVLQRNCVESMTRREDIAAVAIIDAQGQVVRPMMPPTSRWRNFIHPPPGGRLGDIERAVALLSTGAYAAVNGKRAWRTFRAVDGSPGVTESQIVASGGGPSPAGDLLEPMESSKVLTVHSKGHYLDAPGRGLLAASQRVTEARVYKRWGVYSKKGGEYRRSQRLHNQGQADSIIWLRRHGFPAFPAMGIVIDYWYGGKRARVVPDGFVVLPPGVIVALEFERSATFDQDIKDKADKYQELAELRCPLVVLFITETPEAAEKLCRLRHPFLLATSLEKVKKGPHGTFINADGMGGPDSGCWAYWYQDRDAPSFQVPIDLLAQRYAENARNVAWRLPVHNPFRVPQATRGEDREY